MLSKAVITQQRLVVFVDEVGLDGQAQSIITQLLKEQSQDNIKYLPLNDELKNTETFPEFVKECKGASGNLNIVLPTLANMHAYIDKVSLFKFVHALKKTDQVQRTFLWLSRPHIMHEDADYLIAGFEYLADLIVHLQTAKQLTICKRSPGGAVTKEHYTYQRTLDEFTIEPMKRKNSMDYELDGDENNDKQKKPEHAGTFKIELEEEELMARNAMKMPYERTSEATEGKIIITSEGETDSDEEDVDWDLFI